MIVAGFGFKKGTDVGALRDALARAQAAAPHVSALATVADKTAELEPLARELNLPLIAVEAERLAAIRTMTVSQASLDAHATGSVAEASALAAAGEGARLVAPRHVSADRKATCAIAMGGAT